MENFILAFRRQTWLGIIQDNDNLIENVSETEWNSKLTTKNLFEDTLESKSDNHDNVSFPFLKKIKSQHPKNLFFGQVNVISIRNNFDSVQLSSNHLKYLWYICCLWE